MSREEIIKELTLVTICINETTQQMNTCSGINGKFKALRKERKIYLTDQVKLKKQLNYGK